MPSGKKRTHDEFMKELTLKNGDVQVLGTYQKNTHPIACRCGVCGYEWSPTPKSLLNGHGCPKCSNNVKLSHAEFLELLNNKNPKSSTFILIENYEGMSKRIKCKCKVCQTEWSPKANDLVRAGTGCPACSGNIKYTHERFLMDFCRKNQQSSAIEILSDYRGMTERVQCRCKDCGYMWAPIASSLIQGTGCPECAKHRIGEQGRNILKTLPRAGRDSHELFLKKLANRNPHSKQIEICSTYKGANDSIKCKCLVCGLEWNTIASGLLQGTGCPKCSHTSTSFMEQFLLYAFRKALENATVLHRDKYSIGNEIDILIPEYKLGIEIGSWHWHKHCIEADVKKVQKCAENDIRLIVIYDSCNETVSLGDDFWTYPYDLGSEDGHTSLKKIVCDCLNIMDISYFYTEKEWIEIDSNSYEASYRVNDSAFLEKLKAKNRHYDDLILMSQYRYAKDKISCKCRKCGHEWKTAASELLKGTGCPVCQIKAVGEKKSKKKQIQEWRKNNPTGTKMQCEKETRISRMTVYKWWDSGDFLYSVQYVTDGGLLLFGKTTISLRCLQ